MRWNIRSLKFKIILYTALCVFLVGVVSNVVLYHYMNRIITEKADSIDTMYLTNIQAQLNTNLSSMQSLANLCASDMDVSSFVQRSDSDSSEYGRAALRVQKSLNTYLSSSEVSRYVRRLIVFGEDGVSVHAAASAYGNNDDVQNIMETEIYQKRDKAPQRFTAVAPSIVKAEGDCLALLYKVDSALPSSKKSYLYMEVNLSLMIDVLAPYTQLNDIFVATEDARTVISPREDGASIIKNTDLSALLPGSVIQSDGASYRIYAAELHSAGLTVYNCVNISSTELDSHQTPYIVFITILTCVVISLGILIIVSSYITRPVNRLITRIKKISDKNDFSFDPEIERSKDEIGEIGHVVNEMSVSIQNLLDETIKASEERKNIEIALLQSQVNPHFLYNTLDSIRWMAVIQKNPGIVNITRSLVNLLKNMAKGFSQKITLQEELSLLNDYTTIQAIRYLETFEIVNNISQDFYSYTIIKMTLQPLVENAIFHGIEPTGVFGTITLDAYADEQFLYVTVRDNGVGMTQEEIHALLTRTKQSSKDSMNGIGVANVDKRLKLTYGRDCGLSIESQKGEYTLVTVKIRKEKEP